VSTGLERTITSGIDASERRAFIAPFVIDPQRSTRLYFGGSRVFRTSNEGTAWTAISSDLTRGTGVIAALAVAPSDSAVIFAGTNDGNVRYTRDYGVTWLSPSTTLPARAVTDFAIDPADADRVVVTYGSSGTSHVFRSDDGGVTWTDINGTLPDVTTQAAVWGPGGRLFVGNMLGAYESRDRGATWTRNEGLPTIRITDLVYNPRTNRLVAATYGRGIWAFDFTTAAAVLRGDVNSDNRVDAADALLIQQGLIGVQVSAAVSLFPAGDADCNGKLEVRDALVVVKFAVGDVVAGSCVGTRR
ncbi:dockerin type I domain-containing protein, partial [Gemmatimonas sp.]